MNTLRAGSISGIPYERRDVSAMHFPNESEAAVKPSRSASVFS